MAAYCRTRPSFDFRSTPFLLMQPLNIHWKHYILPTSITLVSVWTMYLGAVALFQPLDDTSSDGEVRASRASLSQRDSKTSESGSRKSADRQRRSGPPKTSNLGVVKKVGSGSVKSSSNYTKAQRAYQKSGRLAVRQEASLSPKGGGVKKTAGDNSKALLRESILAEAFSLAMKSEKPWQNLLAIAKIQHGLGQKEAARDILLMAEKLAANPDDEVKSSSAIREVVKMMLSQQLNEDAIAALQNIRDGKMRERAVSEVAAWSARQGRVDLARNLIGQIVNAGARDVALVAIAESEASFEGTSLAMQTVGTIVNSAKKDDAYRRIALKRAAVNDFIHADQAVQFVRNDRVKNSTLSSLAKQRVRSGDSAGGLNTLQYVNDPLMADSALRELSAELARRGEFSVSGYVTTRIRGEQEKSYALESLSVEQAKTGDLSGSLVRTSAIPLKSVRERALRSVSAVTAGNGEPERARNVAVRIDSEKERARAYSAIAQASTVDGDHHTAYNTLQEIDRPDEKALALVSMARTRQRQGDSRQALSMLEDARREAGGVTSVATMDRIQSDLAVAYAERRDSSRSLILVEKISNLSRRDAAYGNLARTLMGKFDIHGAQQSVRSISSETLRIKAGDDVARSLAKRVPLRDAVRKSRMLQTSRQRIVFLLEVSRKT